MLLKLQNLYVNRFMNDQLIPFNLRNIIIIIYSSKEYPTEKQDTVQHETQLRSSGEESAE